MPDHGKDDPIAARLRAAVEALGLTPAGFALITIPTTSGTAVRIRIELPLPAGEAIPLDDDERRVVRAVLAEPKIGKKIAAAVGAEYGPPFRKLLSRLVKKRALQKTGDGYGATARGAEAAARLEAG